MRTILLLLLSTLAALAQGGSYCTMSTWEPRNISTKAGIVASYDPGNTGANVSNPAGWAAGSGVSALSNRVTMGTLDLLQTTAANQPILSRADNSGNICLNSDSITPASWSVTDATKTGANELTFTAQNGQIIQNIPTSPGISYVFSFWARTNIPGNTSLTILTLNSASGDTTAQTITGTLAQYSVTVLGRSGNGGTVSFGIRDANASGFGSIIWTNSQVRVLTWDSNYISTTAAPIYAGLGGRQVMYFDGVGSYISTSAFALAQPLEFYGLIHQITWTLNSSLCGGITSFDSLYQAPSVPSLKTYASALGPETTNLPMGTWGAVFARFNGTYSSIAINKNAPSTHTAGTSAQSGVSLGSTSLATFGNLEIGRYILCTKSNDVPELSFVSWGLMKQAGVY